MDNFLRSAILAALVTLTLADTLFPAPPHAPPLIGILRSQAPLPAFTPSDQVRLQGSTVLIVTHASAKWDSGRSTEAASNLAVQQAAQRGISSVYLQDSLDSSYFSMHHRPTYFVQSGGGEFSFPVPATTVISTGGWNTRCRLNTIQTLLEQWSTRRENLNLCHITPAIYDLTGSFLLPRELQARAEETLRPRYRSSTVPLSDLLDLFPNDPTRLDYLVSQVNISRKQAAGSAPILSAAFRVVVRYRGIERVIQVGNGANPPTFTITYVHPRTGQPLNLSECERAP